MTRRVNSSILVDSAALPLLAPPGWSECCFLALFLEDGFEIFATVFENAAGVAMYTGCTAQKFDSPKTAGGYGAGYGPGYGE